MIGRRLSAREFVERLMDEAELHGMEQIDEVGFDAATWAGVTGNLDDLLMTLARAQKNGSTVAVVVATVTHRALDVTAFVESIPEGQEEVLAAGDSLPVLAEPPGGGVEIPEPG